MNKKPIIILTLMLIFTLTVSTVQGANLTNNNYVLNNELLKEYNYSGVPTGSILLFRVEGNLNIADIGFQGNPSNDLATYKIYLDLAKNEERIWSKYPPEEQYYGRRDELKKYEEEMASKQNPFAPTSGTPGVPASMKAEVRKLKIVNNGAGISSDVVTSIPVELMTADSSTAICGAMGTNVTLSDGVYVIIPPQGIFSPGIVSGGISIFMTGSGKIKVISSVLVEFDLAAQINAAENGLGIDAGDEITKKGIIEFEKQLNKDARAELEAKQAAEKAKAEAAAKAPIKLVLDGKTIATDVPPQAINGRTLVPLRAFVEAIGYNAIWVNETKTIYITGYGGTTLLEMSYGSQYAISYIDNSWGEKRIMDVPPQAINGRTMVPARFIAETFGYSVTWDQKTKTVYIVTPLG